MDRRHFLKIIAGGVVPLSFGEVYASRGGEYENFLMSVQQEALSQGVERHVLEEAFMHTSKPNVEVLERDRHQPEFSLTWEEYRSRILNDRRFEQGIRLYRDLHALAAPIAAQEGCDLSGVMGIWGLESRFGETQGRFNVIDALATLAFDGRRSHFFHGELLNALTILNEGDIRPAAMLGSYAGAMGQAQFMPSAYLRYAADGDGDGRRNIWTSRPDVWASIARYLGQSGWQRDALWGEEVSVPLGHDGHFSSIAATSYRTSSDKTLEEWRAMGVSPINGQGFKSLSQKGRLIQPDGSGGQAFLVYNNFRVIRAYNPSDYYALAVAILGERITQGA